MPTDHPADPQAEARTLVGRAVEALVPATETVERKARPESTYTWRTPKPLAGLKAALTVAQLAQDKAYEFARQLRAEGSSWLEIADLLEIPWSEEHSRVERAYEVVAGKGHSINGPRVYWTCGGPLGCGQDVIDYGPYNGYPSDNERGHDEGCRRLAAENAAYERECEERDERARVMDEAMPQITDPFGRETVKRARYVRAHGGRYLGWSTSESLAVALVLEDADQLKAHGYATPQEALARVIRGLGWTPKDVEAWLRLLRAAATGKGAEG